MPTTTQIQQQITQTATTAGIDPNLALAVAQTESAFNPAAVSSVGAIGVFQLMPATAAGLGVDPTDLNQNIEGGVALLKQLLTQYNGNVTLALAAYNAGPGAVAKYNGVPPYAETQNYVTQIQGILSSEGDTTGFGVNAPVQPQGQPGNADTSDVSSGDGSSNNIFSLSDISDFPGDVSATVQTGDVSNMQPTDWLILTVIGAVAWAAFKR